MEDIWTGNIALKERFLIGYSLSMKKEGRGEELANRLTIIVLEFALEKDPQRFRGGGNVGSLCSAGKVQFHPKQYDCCI